jgi:hypothetical protein
MADVDWDKIIRAAQSKKKEEEKREELEKRLRRMESTLRKVAAEKDAAAARAERPMEPASRRDSIRRLLGRKGEEDKLLNRLEKLERLEHELERKSADAGPREDVPPGFKIVRVPKRSAINLGKAGAAVGEKLSAGAKALFSNRRNMIAAVGVLAIVAVAALYLTGNLNLPNFSGLTGLFSSKPKITYVCSDGVTTVENMTMCPTTTTTSTTTTTTTTTIPATTTTTTTLPPCAGNYCVYLKQLTCSGSTINAVLVNSGSKSFTTDIFLILKFLVNNEEKPFVCSPMAVSVGGTMTCMYTTPVGGTFDIEVRGPSLGNIEKGTVTC